MIGVACALWKGFAVNFPEEPDTAQIDLREIGPHMMFSPPRIWENMVSDVQVKVEDSSRLKRSIYRWSIRKGEQAADLRMAKRPLPARLALENRIAGLVCFLWIKDKLGLRRIKRAYTGGAALGPDIFRFFHALGINLKQIYGQTEVSGISVLHGDGDVKYQTVGVPVPGCEIRIADSGEILTRSPSVFIGYYKNPEATAETLEDGWLHSGDAGYLDADGHLVVIDRAKDVMTLHDGTKFSPQFLENKLKWSPYIREAVVFGGGDWPFVTALVTIDFANAGKWAEKRQLPYTTFTDLSQKREMYALARDHVERINADLPEAARIRRFLLLHKELDADDAELTRTRKVRRGFIAERYRTLVDALYSGADTVPVEAVITYQDGRTATTRTELGIETLAPGVVFSTASASNDVGAEDGAGQE
jgi:long-chain acyl-CoA synthetase